MRWIAIILILSCSALRAQFESGSVRVDGLTCSMCQKSAHSALTELPFVESIIPDLESASFKLKFKKDVAVDPELIRIKIEEAGFSIGELKLKVNLGDLTRISDSFFLYGSYYFFVVNEMNAEKGIKEYKVMDKGFVSKKEYNSNAKQPKYKCVYKPSSEGCIIKLENNYPIIHLSL